MKRLRIFGAGIRGAVIADLVGWQLSDDFVIDGFYDDVHEPGTATHGGSRILGSVEQGLEESAGADFSVIIGFGTRGSDVACSLLMQLRERGVTPVSLIARDAHVSPSATIGSNTMVMPGVYVGARATIGDLCTTHGGVVVEHDSRIDDNVLLGPGVVLASACHVSSHVFLGAGTRLVPDIEVGVGSLVGAGSTVTRPVPPHVVAFGNPVSVKRATSVEDEVPDQDAIERLHECGFPVRVPV